MIDLIQLCFKVGYYPPDFSAAGCFGIFQTSGLFCLDERDQILGDGWIGVFVIVGSFSSTYTVETKILAVFDCTLSTYYSGLTSLKSAL